MRFTRWLLTFLLFFLSQPSRAALTSSFDAQVGFLGANISAGQTFNGYLETLNLIQTNYTLHFTGPNLSLNLSFLEVPSSNLGLMPLTRLGMGLRWYFLGHNGARVIYDNAVSGNLWTPTPFIGLELGLSNLTINSESTFFDAASVDMKLDFGIEVPMDADWILLGQLGFLANVSSFGAESVSSQVSYSALYVQCGFRVIH